MASYPIKQHVAGSRASRAGMDHEGWAWWSWPGGPSGCANELAGWGVGTCDKKDPRNRLECSFRSLFCTGQSGTFHQFQWEISDCIRGENLAK